MFEEHENVLDKAATVPSSDVFHIMVVREGIVSSREETSCGAKRVSDITDELDRIDMCEATEQGMRPCKRCIKHLGDVYNIDCAMCVICERLTLIHDAEYSTHTIAHNYGNDIEVKLCSDCKEQIRTED